MKGTDVETALFDGLILGLVLLMVLTSFNYGLEARTLPIVMGSLTLMMLILTLIKDVNPKLQKKLNISLFDYKRLDSLRKADESEKLNATIKAKSVLSSITWTAGYCILILLVGFHVAIPVASFLILKFQVGAGWLKSAALAGVLWGIILVGFQIALGLELFRGILFGERMPAF